MEEVKKPRLTKYGLEQMAVNDKKLFRCKAVERDRVLDSIKVLIRNQAKLGKTFEAWPVKIGIEYKRTA